MRIEKGSQVALAERIVPMVQTKPTEEIDHAHEREAEHATDSRRSEERGSLELGTVDDGSKTQAANSTDGAAGEKIADHRTDRGEDGRNAQAGEEVRQRRWYTQ